jgi:hypothetical protein
MSMWEQLDNISDYYKPTKRTRTEALRILRKRYNRKKPRSRERKDK